MSTLLIVVLVAIVAASFLAGIASERVTAHAYGNVTRAGLAADGAAESGMARLRHLFERYPASASAWEQRPGFLGTALHYREVNEEGELVRGVAPLVSGAGELGFAAWKSGASFASLVKPAKEFEDAANSVDLNAVRYAMEPGGWIGSPAGAPRQEVRVPWVELRDSREKLVARYAYWIEDESFKVALNAIGGMLRGVGSPGAEPREVPIQGLLNAVAKQGGGDLSKEAEDALASAIITLRDGMPGKQIADWNVLNGLAALPSAGSTDGAERLLGGQLRFYGALGSETLNLTQQGGKRLDLNKAFASPAEGEAVRVQIDRVTAAIGHHLPAFGQRFYRLGADRNAKNVSDSHSALYKEKLAVNIRDAMLPQGAVPTLVAADGSVVAGSRPVRGIEPLPGPAWPGAAFALMKGGENSARAIGKKNLPYLQEWACHVKVHQFSPIVNTQKAEANFSFSFNTYFEFWNMSPVDIDAGKGDLGANPFLRVYDLPGFNIGSGITAGGAFEIPLDGVVFPAGRVTVVTTAPTRELNKALLTGSSTGTPGSNIVSVAVPDVDRIFTGVTTLTTSDGKFRVNLLSRSRMDATDYETKVVMGNDAGLLESFCGLALARGKTPANNALSLHNDIEGDPEWDVIVGVNHEQFFVRGGSLHGSRKLTGANKLAQTGDPRSANEQLFLRVYDKAGDAEQTRYYNSELDNYTGLPLNVPAESTIGFPNANFVEPPEWPDAFQWASDGVNTPAYYPAGPLRSIGELGHVYDPARSMGPSGNILYSRGGGRTLAIGQPDPMWDGEAGSASMEWRAWKLVDLFSTTSELSLPGRVNLNGILRDGGVAFRTLLYGFQYASDAQGDPGLAARALPKARLAGVVEALRDRLKAAGPLFERGELSELMGGEPGAAYDRGREELFRRMVELTATRGSLFTLYAIGEAAKEMPSGEIVGGARAWRKVTFRLVPVWEAGLDDLFAPTSADAVAARFRKPDRFAIEIVRVEQ